jgi:hypothetical protein
MRNCANLWMPVRRRRCAGMNREQAFRQTKMEIEGLEAVKENVRQTTWESWIVIPFRR